MKLAKQSHRVRLEVQLVKMVRNRRVAERGRERKSIQGTDLDIAPSTLFHLLFDRPGKNWEIFLIDQGLAVI